jgi:hypothetical protein
MRRTVARHTIEHGLDHARARHAIGRAVEDRVQEWATTKYGARAAWSTEEADRCDVEFVVFGRRVEGVIRVTPERVVIEVELPPLLRAFEARAIKLIEDDVCRYLKQAEHTGKREIIEVEIETEGKK